jgi:integrase
VFSELSDYDSWLKRTKKPDTRNYYLRVANEFLKFCKKPSDKVDIRDVTRWLDEIEKSIKPQSSKVYCHALKCFMEWAGRTDLVGKIPAPFEFTTKEPKWLPEDKIEKIIASANGIFGRAILQTAYDLCLRVNEVPLLNRSWLDVDRKVCKVYRLKKKRYPEHEVPVEDKTIQYLTEYLSTRDDDLDAMFVVRGGRGNPGLHRINYQTVEDIYRDAAKRAGIDPNEYRFHSFSRHCRLTHLAIHQLEEFGVIDPIVLAKRSGHSNINMLLIYSHIAAEHLRGKGK